MQNTTNNKTKSKIIEDKNKKDEFYQLKALALELKNIQLQIIKDLNKGNVSNFINKAN
ncbi:hypothetical protein [Helicobacter sp. MIT 14-3879]|uniref:hypothetical protein n=1 Tax=Helicobacter sp. MIT 14-3879 TaxID=2040649 RepID=UPI0015F1B517|nr:hypothetical protein [Helicobacter sp. MIT 14-3879]